MLAFFIFCLGTSLSILALYVCIHWPGMLLNFSKNWLERLVSAPVKKPVYNCLICMSSVWTTILWLAVYGLPKWHLVWAILIVAGINTLICITLENQTDYGC